MQSNFERYSILFNYVCLMILNDFFFLYPKKSIKRIVEIYSSAAEYLFRHAYAANRKESWNQVFSGISSFQKESKDLCQLEPRESRLVDSITTYVEILLDAQLCRTGRSALTAIIYS